MAWYDLFSRFYDASLEPHYREQRALAREALELTPGLRVLDLPCGTGQSFAGLVEGVGPGGQVLGVDLSPGMLREARRRCAGAGWENVSLLDAAAGSLGPEDLGRALGGAGQVDRLHIFLGLSVFPEWEACFDNLWQRLAPGGRCVVVDVHAEQLGLQGHLVNLTARADIRRRFWEPLERLGVDFRREELPSKPLHGGAIYLATARKAPAS